MPITPPSTVPGQRTLGEGILLCFAVQTLWYTSVRFVLCCTPSRLLLYSYQILLRLQVFRLLPRNSSSTIGPTHQHNISSKDCRVFYLHPNDIFLMHPLAVLSHLRFRFPYIFGALLVQIYLNVPLPFQGRTSRCSLKAKYSVHEK